MERSQSGSGDLIEFARHYHPKGKPKQYEWVIHYAKESISLLVHSLETLDSKTETLMRYLGGVAIGLVTLLPVLFTKNPDITWWLFPSIVLLLAGAVQAGRSCAPQDFYAPPSIRQAFRFADAYGDVATVNFHAFWAPLENQLKALTEAKERAYRRALQCLWIATGWLVVVALGTTPAGTQKISMVWIWLKALLERLQVGV